jgi:mannosyltransferase
MQKTPSSVTADPTATDTDQAPEPRGRIFGAPKPTRAEAVLAVVVLAGVLLRFWARSPLWLDEALSVNISKLPVRDIPQALLRDGAPPLYYFLLHFWVRIFGSGDLAVRALSGLFSVATLPAVWIAGRRLGGRKMAGWALLVAASSPFAIRYATETRMYSLIAFLVAWGFLAFLKSLEDPSPFGLAGVALTTTALALTHYWALYLIFVVGVGLAVQAVRSPSSRATKLTLAAVVAGAVLWLPWAPKFFYQFQHTGTPWADAPPFGSLFTSVTFWAGGPLRAGPLLGLLFLALIVLALFGRPAGEGRIELAWATRPRAAALAEVIFGTLLLAYLAGVIGHSGFADRYTSIVWPLFVLLVAIGLGALSSGRARTIVLVLIVACGLLGALGNVSLLRTQAGHVARVINHKAKPGDVVAYCPDQLGPAVSRLLHPHFEQITYPSAAGPRFVDWVDYADRNHASDPIRFAHLLETKVPAGGSIWLISSPGYKTFGSKCSALKEELASLHAAGRTLIRRKPKSLAWEREELSVFPSP